MPVELGVGEGSYLEKRRRKGVGGATLYPLKGNTCIQIPSSSLKSREDMVGSFKRKAPYKIRFFFFEGLELNQSQKTRNFLPAILSTL